MRIAVPSNGINQTDEDVAEHFGRCETYTVFDENGKHIETIKNTSEHMGGQGKPPEILKQNKIDVLVCINLGPSAISMCEAFGIQVFLATGTKTKDMVNAFLENKATKANLEDGCKDHMH